MTGEKTFCSQFDDEVVEKVYREMDVNGDGVVDYKDVSEVRRGIERKCNVYIVILHARSCRLSVDRERPLRTKRPRGRFVASTERPRRAYRWTRSRKC